jgi:hypothetical protein
MKTTQVTPSELSAIIETREPLGLFFATDLQTGNYVAVDNHNGEAWTADFQTERKAIKWLENEDNVLPKPINLNKFTRDQLNDMLSSAFLCMIENIEVYAVDKYDRKRKPTKISSVYADYTVTLPNFIHSDCHVSEIRFPKQITDAMNEIKGE